MFCTVFEGTLLWEAKKGNQKERHHVGGSGVKHPLQGLGPLLPVWSSSADSGASENP